MRILADARNIPLKDGCVQCAVTSPPYFGLRDYVISGQIGLESSPDAYVAQLVAVFREVRRVLKDDGTVWLNLGDSYASGEVGRHDSVQANEGRDWNGTRKATVRQQRKLQTGLKPKDLVGIPWRVAFALQADGWYLRSDVIWSKPNPMPESVTDRPTKAHEYVFLLSKSERYFYDQQAIAEPGVGRESYFGSDRYSEGSGRNDSGQYDATPCVTRNARTVWTINPKPYAGAHFATMPEKLAERCILAGSRPGDLVLDPFGGSGTTVRVARRFNRRGVMLDLNPAYLELAEDRVSKIQPSLLHLEEHTA